MWALIRLALARGNDATGSDSELRVAFGRDALNKTSPSATRNFFTLARSSSISLEYRVTKIFLMSDGAYFGTASVIAGLTQISSSHLPTSWENFPGNGG